MKDQTIQFRTDDETKTQAETMAQSYGLSVSAYLTMLIKRDWLAYASAKLAPSVQQNGELKPLVD